GSLICRCPHPSRSQAPLGNARHEAPLRVRDCDPSMTRSRYRIWEQSQPHFLTCTVVGWLPVFTRPETVQIVLDCWRFLQHHERMVLYGYAILENHLHLIASAADLSKEVKAFKSYTARRIIDLLETQRVQVLLDQLAFHKLRHKVESRYQLWQEGSH